MNTSIQNPIPLRLNQSAPGSRLPHMVTLGVPFAQGMLKSVDALAVVTPCGKKLQSAVHVSARWPDGSIKWIRAKFICSNLAKDITELFLIDVNTTSYSTVDEVDFSVERSEEIIRIKNNDILYLFGIDSEHIFPGVSSSGNQIWSEGDIDIRLLDSSGHPLHINKISTEMSRYDSVSVVVEVRALAWISPTGKINMLFRFEVMRGKVLCVTVEMHNSARALHREGLWDLGDANSFCFQGFTLCLKRRNTDRIVLRPEPAGKDYILEDCVDALLFQASSGGANWNGITHVNSRGIVCNQFSGYALELENTTIASGARANPVLSIQRENQGSFVVKIKDFWQNFPKSLVLSKEHIGIGLFPPEHRDAHELQGGERKQHDILFAFSDNANELEWLDSDASVSIDPDTIDKAGVFIGPVTASFAPYDDLIKASLDEVNGFFDKREFQDEFGWRNFGEVVADHESLYHGRASIFVSHYNNQYDAIYGFARQYLLTSDLRWYKLMDELARHVLDIDIYRTAEDRHEYNHGLFWHTDHYLQAFTCSHRTYSREHSTANPDGNKGGGPGPEHCYTNGLALYYYLTGNEDARNAVLGLTDWIRNYYEGTGTLIERCKELATIDRNRFVAVLKGQQVFRYRYPFNRGVGNYIRALLDCYELTLDENYIREAESVIMNTFGCGDDIKTRNLEDIEHTWSYTILLQEVIRYLDLKRVGGSLDHAFCYSRKALLHYAHWMALHETPSLESKKPLEFANDTWIAQDIRKANVLYAAYRYENNNRELLLLRAREFRDYVLESLSKSDSLHFARIQIILLQNHGPSALMDTPVEVYGELIDFHGKNLPVQDCFYTRCSYFKYIIISFWKVVKDFSPRREINWMRARLG